MKTSAFAVAAFAVVAVLPAHAGSEMKPGLWEVTVEAEMAGMPGGMPPTTVRNCVKQSDLDAGRGAMPQTDAGCKVKDYRTQGSTATWAMECTGATKMSGTGTMTFTGTSYTGRSVVTMDSGGQKITMTQTFTGRRVGDCR